MRGRLRVLQVYFFDSYARGDMMEQSDMGAATFSAAPVYRNAVSLCILQIGEL